MSPSLYHEDNERNGGKEIDILNRLLEFPSIFLVTDNLYLGIAEKLNLISRNHTRENTSQFFAHKTVFEKCFRRSFKKNFNYGE